MINNTELVYQHQGGSIIDELSALDESISIYFADFCCIQDEPTRNMLKMKQQEGLKIMLHLPFSYINMYYLYEPLYKQLNDFYEAYKCWLKKDNQPVMVGSLKIIDLSKANIVMQTMKSYIDFIKKYDFIADIYFIDYIIDNPYYISATQDFIAKWKFGSYKTVNYLVNLMKASLNSDIKFIGNGWHNCKSVDCMCYENFPNTFRGESGYWGYEVSLLDSRYGVSKHNDTFTDKPMMIPGVCNSESIVRDIAFFEAYSTGSYFCIFDNPSYIDIAKRILNS